MDKLVATFTLDETGQTVTAELWHTVPTSKCLIEFRPPKKFDWSFGFDWFREGKRGDEKIDFSKICTTAEALRSNEYKAKDMDFSQWEEPIKGGKKCYDSWLALYPPNKENYGATEATLKLLAYCDKDFHDPLKVEFNSEYFEVTPTTLTLPKSTNNEKGTFLKEALNIKCIKAFSKEQTIKIVSEARVEVGCLKVVPNDDTHRYKLKIRLVNVALFQGDKEALNKMSKNIDIGVLLEKGVLKHCFLRPVIEPVVQELDLTAESAQWESYRKEIPQEGTGILEKVIDSTYLNIVHNKIKLTYDDKTEARHDESVNLIFFFINHKIVFYETGILNNGKKYEKWDYVRGNTDMCDRWSLITQDGVNTRTLSHEALHARNLNHTFPEASNHSNYLFYENETDNIMDYPKKGDTGAHMQATYKWQWDEVKAFAENENIYIKLEKEKESER